MDLTDLAGFAAALTLLTAVRATTFGADLAFGTFLTAGRAAVLGALFTGTLASAADFFLALAFTIGLLWKSAPHTGGAALP